VGPLKAESKITEEIKAEETLVEKEIFGIWPNMQIAESRASGPPLACAHFSLLAMDSVDLTTKGRKL
jgi:hypothetical protein